VLPRLAELEQACRAVKTAGEIRALLDRARSALRGTLSQAGPNAAPAAPAPDALRHFVEDKVFGPNQQGWQRIIYDLQNRMAAFTAAKFDPKDATAWAQHTRVPVAAGSPEQALLLWNEFFATRIDRQVPTLFIRALDQPWLDVICGEPSSAEFFCLRALPDALPMATDVPYDLDEAFKSRARRILADFQHADGLESLGQSDAEEAPPSSWGSFTQRWFRGKGHK
jgi:hypothetical protein